MCYASSATVMATNSQWDWDEDVDEMVQHGVYVTQVKRTYNFYANYVHLKWLNSLIKSSMYQQLFSNSWGEAELTLLDSTKMMTLIKSNDILFQSFMRLSEFFLFPKAI